MINIGLIHFIFVGNLEFNGLFEFKLQLTIFPF